ncbi:hypothetical protein BBP40_003169 [Aspergillus hancockii]|nr:hypothetical protein BBP40_003169 [Aspergillus hancockii]
MADLDATTPRIFLARHGITDLDLTPEGIKQVTSTGDRLVGPGKLIDPGHIARVWDIAEWDYGDYEGSAPVVEERLDRLVGRIREIQGPYMDGSKPVDVILVAHGLILRAFVKRWLKYSLDTPLPMSLFPGAIGVLSYLNHDVDEPGFHIGMALP